MRDRASHVTGPGVNVIFQGLIIQNGGAGGASTDRAAQNANRAGGGILNNGGGVTLDNVGVFAVRLDLYPTRERGAIYAGV